MAQVDEFQRAPKKVISNTIAASAALTASSVKYATINTRGVDRIHVQITVALAAITGFAIKVKANAAQSTEDTLYKASADFTAPVGVLVGASEDLTTLGTSAPGWFILDVTGFDEVYLYATDSATTATIAFEIGGF